MIAEDIAAMTDDYVGNNGKEGGARDTIELKRDREVNIQHNSL